MDKLQVGQHDGPDTLLQPVKSSMSTPKWLWDVIIFVELEEHIGPRLVIFTPTPVPRLFLLVGLDTKTLEEITVRI
jgi:hypothetical protein